MVLRPSQKCLVTVNAHTDDVCLTHCIVVSHAGYNGHVKVCICCQLDCGALYTAQSCERESE